MGLESSAEVEEARCAALASFRIVDTPPDPEFDAFVGYATRLTGAPTALISLVDQTRQWFKARIGMAAQETSRNVSFCAHAILQRDPLIVHDARQDPRFADNPLVTGTPHIVFYAGWPLITHDGHALGSLCVIDRVPRVLTASQLDAMALLARQVVLSLELRRTIINGGAAAAPISDGLAREEYAEAERVAQAELAQLVVHDLKNPLTMIAGNLAFVAEVSELGHECRDALADALTGVDRMRGMLADLLDIWTGQTSTRGLVARPAMLDAAALVREIVGHGRAGRAHLVAELEQPQLWTRADRDLLGRLLGNLVDNAQRYAPAGSDIVIAARRQLGRLELAVRDTGPGIADADKTRIFEKYIQLDDRARTGRGLGLLFCRLATEAHGGRIWVEDNAPQGAVFRVTIPDA